MTQEVAAADAVVTTAAEEGGPQVQRLVKRPKMEMDETKPSEPSPAPPKKGEQS